MSTSTPSPLGPRQYTFFLNSTGTPTTAAGEIFSFAVPQQVSAQPGMGFKGLISEVSFPNFPYPVSSLLNNNKIKASLEVFVESVTLGNAFGGFQTQTLNQWMSCSYVNDTYFVPYATPNNFLPFPNQCTDLTLTITNGVYATIGDLVTAFNAEFTSSIANMNATLLNVNSWGGFAGPFHSWDMACNLASNATLTQISLFMHNAWVWAQDNSKVATKTTVMGLFSKFRWHFTSCTVMEMLGWGSGDVLWDFPSTVVSYTTGNADQRANLGPVLINSPHNWILDPNVCLFITCTNLQSQNCYVSSPGLNVYAMFQSNTLCTLYLDKALARTSLYYNVPAIVPFFDTHFGSLEFTISDYRNNIIPRSIWPSAWLITFIVQEYPLPVTQTLNVQQLNDQEMEWIQEQQLQTQMQLEMLKHK